MTTSCPQCLATRPLNTDTVMNINCPECSYRFKGPVPLEFEALEEVFDVPVVYHPEELMSVEEHRQMLREEEQAGAYEHLMERIFA